MAQNGLKRSQQFKEMIVGPNRVLTGIRSASPTAREAMMHMSTWFDNYWKYGTTETDETSRSLAVHPNPMFTPQDGNMFLHYGTDPLLCFHLAASYAPVASKSPLSLPSPGLSQEENVVKLARLEFSAWMKSFRAYFVADSITLRFFAGDALAFAHTLQQRRMPGSPNSAHHYRDRYHFEPLVLNEEDYSGGSAPLVFDVIDTSNLIDHLGALNVLTATSPLLGHSLTATLYTEKLVQSEDTHKDLLNNLLYGNLTTVSSLLGLVPVDIATNTSAFSVGEEAVIQAAMDTQRSANGKAGQLFARIAWKRPVASADKRMEALELIHFDSTGLALVLYRIFLKMFADEDVRQLMSRMTMMKFKKASLPTSHRASFAVFLRLVKTRSSVDWDKTILALLEHIHHDTSLSFTNSYMQELTLWLHLLGLFTADVLKSPPNRLSSSPRTGDLRDWRKMPPVVGVTLQVPKRKLDVFIRTANEKKFTPPIQAILQSSDRADNQWQNMFAAVQVGFGNLTTKGVRHTESFELQIAEDKSGWAGDSPMLVSFLVPSWMLLQEPRAATVTLAILPTIGTVQFDRTSGPNLSIFTTTLQDAAHVYITKHLPHQNETISICGFVPSDVTDLVDPERTSETTVMATVDEKTGHITSFTSRVQILSEESKAALQNGSTIIHSARSPFNFTLSLPKGPNFTVLFPAPVLDSSVKTRVARKSSYIELVAQVAKPTDWSTFRSFMYPVFLDSGSPVTWNMPYLNLRPLPVLDVAQTDRLRWLTMHLATMWSARETFLRSNPSAPASPGERVRVEFKDSLFHIFMYFSGVQGERSHVFGINCPADKGVHILLFVSDLRFDLSNRTVVLDAAVLPLYTKLMLKILPSLGAMATSGGLRTVTTTVEEMQVWKETLPAWVERCRTWSHKSRCEYVAAGRIPLSTKTGERVLCSCGEGTVPTNYISDVPQWRDFAKHAVRVAISPSFPSAMIDNVLDLTALGVANDATGRETNVCRLCGKSEKPDGSALMTCSRCKRAKYCSRDCQKADWKQHRNVCTRG